MPNRLGKMSEKTQGGISTHSVYYKQYMGYSVQYYFYCTSALCLLSQNTNKVMWREKEQEISKKISKDKFLRQMVF